MIVDINGKQVAQEIKEQLKLECEQLIQRGSQPKLIVISVGEDPASKVYVRNKEKAAKEVGIKFENIHIDNSNLDEDALFMALLYNVTQANDDKNVTGLIIQKPIPGLSKELEEVLFQQINPNKDVDGFTFIQECRLYENNYDEIMIPCTVKGTLELLDKYNIEVQSKEVVIIGRSLIVGKPMAMALLNKDATVTICHSKTKDLKEITKRADILISAIGKPKMITKDYISEKTKVLIDVGINRDENGKLCGDIDYEDISKINTIFSRYITPVPGGVGPMTVAMLMYNTILAAKIQEELNDEEM